MIKFLQIETAIMLGVSMFAATSSCNAAQKSLASADAEVASMLANIRSKEFDGDQSAANEEFVSFLSKICKEPASFSLPFEASAKAGLALATSSDNKMRIYSWDSGGGTMRFFTSLAQYKVSADRKTKVVVLHPKHHPILNEEDLDAGWNYSEIRTIKTAHGKPIYLAYGHGKFSRFGWGLSLEAFSIQHNRLIPAPILEEGEKLVSHISASLTGGSGSIEFSNFNENIEIPETTKECFATGRVIRYKFDGEIFEFEGPRVKATSATGVINQAPTISLPKS